VAVEPRAKKAVVVALSPKQQVFVEEYLTTWNATEAARRAGYSHANKQGPRLLVNVGIAEEIQRRIAERTMTADEVLVRLAEQARAEYSAYLTLDGTVDFARLIADGKGHLVKGIKDTAQGRNIEFHDAQAALVQIGKHHKLFTDKVEVEHSGSVEITADERAQAAKELEQWNEQKKAGAR
jgi:phage terminase small subunit